MNWSGRRRGIERSDICDKGYDENVEIEKKKKKKIERERLK